MILGMAIGFTWVYHGLPLEFTSLGHSVALKSGPTQWHGLAAQGAVAVQLQTGKWVNAEIQVEPWSNGKS